MITSRGIVPAVGLLVSSAVITGVVAASVIREGPRVLERPGSAADALPPGARGVDGLEAGESRLAVRFVAASGTHRGVYVTRTADGSMTCLWDTSLLTGRQGGGCNLSSDFFAGRSMVISLAYDGGPAIKSVADARIVGVVADRVVRVEVLNSAGRSRPVAITPDRAFAYVVPPGELKMGVGPVAVISFDSAGDEIDRQPTGIG